jgi:RND family efflux transporter MFP subunit
MSGAFHPKVRPAVVAAAAATLPEGARTAPVVLEERDAVEEAAGAVVAARRTVVSPRIMAAIRAIHVRAGDRVKEGDVVAVLDDRDLKARAGQADKALEAAEAQLKLADAEHRRRERLFAEKVIAQSELDAAQRGFQVAKAEVERAKRAVDEAHIALSYPQIQAPVSGRVIERLAEPGDTATPGNPILEIYDPAALQLEAAVRESLASRLKPGDPLEVRIDAVNETLEARVEEIVPQSELGSRVFRVKAGLPPSDRLYTGMFGRLLIPVGRRAMTLVPAAAIETIGQNRFATVVEKDKRLSRRLVTLGPAAGNGMIEVLSGLQSGETVVLQP